VLFSVLIAASKIVSLLLYIECFCPPRHW
jgi:hypothetical protein